MVQQISKILPTVKEREDFVETGVYVGMMRKTFNVKKMVGRRV